MRQKLPSLALIASRATAQVLTGRGLAHPVFNYPCKQSIICASKLNAARKNIIASQALHRIEHLKDAGNGHELSVTEASPFKSVDPAAPAASCSSVDQLRFVESILIVIAFVSLGFRIVLLTHFD